VWLAFASAAVSGHVPADDVEDHDEFVQDVHDTACDIADMMTAAFEERLHEWTQERRQTNGKPPRRRPRDPQPEANDE